MNDNVNGLIRERCAGAAGWLKKSIERFNKTAEAESYSFAITSLGDRLALAEHEAALWREGAALVNANSITGAARFLENLNRYLYETARAAKSSNDIDRQSRIEALAAVIREMRFICGMPPA